MFYGLNLMHLLMALGAAGCVRLAQLEIRGRSMSPRHLSRLPLLATVTACIFLLFFLAAHWPPWMFGAALLVGLPFGAARGLTMTVEFDHMWHLVRPTGRRLLLWVALALAGAVALEMAGAVAGPFGAIWRLVAAEVAALCTGMLIGRALAIAVRILKLPHAELRR
jgi:hypothetical protein